MALITNNVREFERVPGLKLGNWADLENLTYFHLERKSSRRVIKQQKAIDNHQDIL